MDVDITVIYAALMEAATLVENIVAAESQYDNQKNDPNWISAQRWRTLKLRTSGPSIESETVAELRNKLHKAHAELVRRHDRDAEIAKHLPAIAARLQSLAEDAKADL